MLESLKKSPLKIGIILAVLIIFNVVGWYAYLNWDKPFGDPLDLPTATTGLETTATPDESANTPDPSDSVTETPLVEITPTLETVCGDDPSLTYLVTGVDSKGYLFGLADSIRVYPG